MLQALVAACERILLARQAARLAALCRAKSAGERIADTGQPLRRPVRRFRGGFGFRRERRRGGDLRLGWGLGLWFRFGCRRDRTSFRQ